jgi:hypothetical protein
MSHSPNILKSAVWIMIIGIALSACSGSEKYKTEITQLNETLVLIDSANCQLNTLDTTTLKQSIQGLYSNLTFIAETVKDTITKDKALFLSECYACENAFKKIIAYYQPTKKELLKSKKQLSDLIHDLTINKVENSKAESFTEIEIKHAHEIINTVGAMKHSADVHISKFKKNITPLTEFVNELRAKAETDSK